MLVCARMAEKRPISAAARGARAVPILPILLQRLAAEGLRYGVYKNFALLDRAALGAMDFDLIVQTEDALKFRAIMIDLGGVQASCSRFYDNAVSGREDWFVPDTAGTALHFDVSFGLRIGPKFNKRYLALGFEDISDWQNRLFADASIPVVSGVEAARIAILRSIFSLSSLTMNGWARLDCASEAILADLIPVDVETQNFHYRLADREIVCQVRRQSGGFAIPGKTVRQMRAALRSGAMPRRIFAPLTDLVFHGVRKVTFAVLRRLSRHDPTRNAARRKLSPRGIVVALIGPDGVGKSTQTSRLQAMFGERFRCGRVYLGSNDGAWMAWRGRLRSTFTRLRSARSQSDDHVNRSGGGKPSYRKAFGRAVWRLVIAVQRRSALRKCQRLADRGVIVIADRWPQDLRRGYLDGPSTPPPEDMKLPFWLWRIEDRLYAGMARHRPDVTIHLDCDFATSNGRKPGDISEAAFELRVALMREMRERDADVKVVDARQDIDAVTAELWRWVWFAMNRAQKR